VISSFDVFIRLPLRLLPLVVTDDISLLCQTLIVPLIFDEVSASYVYVLVFSSPFSPPPKVRLIYQTIQLPVQPQMVKVRFP